MSTTDTANPVVASDATAPHRCPACRAAVVPGVASRWQVYTCHRCRALFTRWPRLARFLPLAPCRTARPATWGREYMAALPAIGSSPPITEVSLTAQHLNNREARS